MPLVLVEYLHILLAFVFVASTLASNWNVLAARRAASWAERASHLELNRRLALIFGLPALIGTGILGNLYAAQLGYRMSESRPLQLVTALWLLSLIVSVVFGVRVSARLAVQARAATGGNGGEPVDWAAGLARWRVGNAVQLLLFLILLWFMVTPWKA